jgi:hypothetical protein
MIKTFELVILGCILLGLMLLGSMGFLSAQSRVEGFNAPAVTLLQVPECPAGYTFFNDKAGASLCCKGTVDPYKHTCGGKGLTDICAFQDNLQDPRNPARFLPQCAEVYQRQLVDESENNCPTGLPYYANDRKGNRKCCKSRASDYGKRCSTVDMNNTDNYCIVDGTAKPGEQMCDDVLLFESAKAGCPVGLSVTPVLLGSREETAYGVAAKGLKVPACVNMTDTCIPDTVITQLQNKKKVYTGKDPATWSKSCSSWKKINEDRDTTFTPVTAYP